MPPNKSIIQIVCSELKHAFGSPDKAAQLFELKQYGNIYIRTNNPTTAVFEERMASLAIFSITPSVYNVFC